MNIITNPPKCYTTITITVNKNLPMDNASDHFAHRPDIYIENLIEENAYIIDVAIVNDKNLVKAYGSKIDTYMSLARKLIEEKKN